MNNKLNYKPKLICLMLWTFLVMGAKAQPNLAFYPFEQQFNSSDYNPAFLTSREKFTFSMFPLAGSSIGFNNQPPLKDLVSKFITATITTQDFRDDFTAMLHKSSFIQNAQGTLLSFTYGSDIGFFNFKIKDSEYILASVEGDITKFIFQPEMRSAVLGQKQYLPIQGAHYREYSLGYSYKSRLNRFSAGIRAKLYFGKFAFFSNMEGSIQGSPDPSNNYALVTSGLINISFPENAILKGKNPTIDFGDSKKMGDYLLNTKNPGMGVDLGFKYHIMPDLTVSMSIIDLGKIKWKSNLNSRSLNNQYVLSNKTNFRIDSVQGVIIKNEGITYSEEYDFSRLGIDTVAFSNPLPTTLYAGVKYQISPSLSLSLHDRFVVVKHLNYNSISLSANLKVNEKLSISSGYSIIGDSYINIPLAFLYQGDFGQIYLGTDNLPSILPLSDDNFAGISFGASFYLFTKRNLYQKSSDLTPFYRPRKIIRNRKSGIIMKANPEE